MEIREMLSTDQELNSPGSIIFLCELLENWESVRAAVLNMFVSFLEESCG